MTQSDFASLLAIVLVAAIFIAGIFVLIRWVLPWSARYLGFLTKNFKNGAKDLPPGHETNPDDPHSDETDFWKQFKK